jgi:ParB/RepB/Spo0J family partition protein
MTTTTKKTTARVSHAKTKTPELPNISSVKLVPLALIDVLPQVRTTFDDESLQELASDIQTRGLLQPILLNPHGQRFTLIAGERRFRACTLAGFSDIPALITKATESEALLMQLAENIQREDLDLEDQVKAIRLLHDHLGNVAAVAQEVKKSSGWVSKRLALSHPDLTYQARQLMEDGITEDVEILNTLSHLAEIDNIASLEVARDIRTGTATRETVRQALKDTKAKRKQATGPNSTLNPAERERIEAERLAEKNRHQEENRLREIERKDGSGPMFIENALAKLQNFCSEPDDDGDHATDYFSSLREDQRDAIMHHLQQLQAKATAWTFREWAWCLTPYDGEYTYLEQYAALMAVKGEKIDNMYALFSILEDANREPK